MRTSPILNVGVSVINMDDACSLIDNAISQRRKIYICVCPVSTIMACQRDEAVLKSVNAADAVTPDGMPVVWILKIRGYTRVTRVYGPDLMRAVCRISARKGYTQYLYGSTSAVLDTLNDNLSKQYPGLRIQGCFSPPFRRLSEQEDAAITAQINSNNPDIIWVGLGSPKQDVWMHEHRKSLNAPVIIGVGAAFDFLAGTKLQAPPWVRNNGFEWLFRLLTEPRRLWRRYLVECPVFLYLLLRQWAKLRGTIKKR